MKKERIIFQNSKRYVNEGNGIGEGLLYCGQMYTSPNGCPCTTCDGQCGPDNGCPCPDCDNTLSYILFSTGKMKCEICKKSLIRIKVCTLNLFSEVDFTCNICLRSFFNILFIPLMFCMKCKYKLCPKCAFSKLTFYEQKKPYIEPGFKAGEGMIYCKKNYADNGHCLCAGCDGNCGPENGCSCPLCDSILGYNRAIVTDIAGTTTDTIEETVEYNGVPVTIIDTAGIRYHTNNTIEKIGQDRAKSSMDIADIILWVIDSNINLDDNDKQIADLLKNKKDKTIVVLNKTDLEPKISKEKLNNLFVSDTMIKFSTVNKTPIENILNKIFEILKIKDIEANSKILLNTRQYSLLCKAQQNLRKIYNLIDKGDSDEIVSFETQNVLVFFNEILGCDVKEDVLHTVFSKFCVGK